MLILYPEALTRNFRIHSDVVLATMTCRIPRPIRERRWEGLAPINACDGTAAGDRLRMVSKTTRARDGHLMLITAPGFGCILAIGSHRGCGDGMYLASRDVEGDNGEDIDISNPTTGELSCHGLQEGNRNRVG